MGKQINGFIYVRAEKGMYGIVQVVIIAHTVLKEHLRPFRYETAPIAPVLWIHNKNKIKFTLVVYEFGIRYQRREDAQHLINTHKEKYEITQDWKGIIYSGITLN